MAKNVSKLVENQQLASLTAQSPELVELLVELKERVSELREKVTPLRVLVGKVSSVVFSFRSCVVHELCGDCLDGVVTTNCQHCTYDCFCYFATAL